MSQAPLLTRLPVTIPGATALVADSVPTKVPTAGTVTRVTYCPEAAITGAAVNNRTIQVVNRGQAGTGSTVVATLTFDAATSAAAYDEKDLALQAAANLAVAAGDILEVRSTPNGTGMVDPGGVVNVEVNR